MREFFLCVYILMNYIYFYVLFFYFSHVFDCACVWVWVLYCGYSTVAAVLTYHCSDFMNIGGKVQPLNKQPPHLTVSPVLLSLKDIPYAFILFLPPPRKILILPFFYPYHV